MVLDKIPNTQLFTQRDVRETPAGTATATSVGLTDGKYIVIDYHADMTDERKITAGAGIDFTDNGANGTFVISCEDSTAGNKGIIIVDDGEGINVSYTAGTVTISGEDASETNKGIIEIATINEVQTGTDEDRAVVPNSLQVVIPPVGAIIAWAKSIAGVPQTLPAGWRLCNGSTINDAESPMNGEDVPDLNGGEFLRGSGTSGGTGGSDTMAHTHGVTSNVTVGNHTSLTLNTDQHNHSVTGSVSSDAHSHNDTFATAAAGDTEQQGEGSFNAAGKNHTHNITGSVSSDSHSHGDTFGTGNDTHGHTFSQNISNHSVTNNGVTSDAASNTENRPKYYNVVWIIRYK